MTSLALEKNRTCDSQKFIKICNFASILPHHWLVILLFLLGPSTFFLFGLFYWLIFYIFQWSSNLFEFFFFFLKFSLFWFVLIFFMSKIIDLQDFYSFIQRYVFIVLFNNKSFYKIVYWSKQFSDSK